MEEQRRSRGIIIAVLILFVISAAVFGAVFALRIKEPILNGTFVRNCKITSSAKFSARFLTERKEAPTTHARSSLLGGADAAISQKDKENAQVIILQFLRAGSERIGYLYQAS